MDELKLVLASDNWIKDCCAIIITESWRHPFIPDGAVQLTDRRLHHCDRNSDSGKSRGRGLCIYTHNNWCTNSSIIHTHCSPDLVSISVVCRHNLQPREITVVVRAAVYILLKREHSTLPPALYHHQAAVDSPRGHPSCGREL